MDNVVFKDKIELSAIFPDFTNITSSTAFMEDNESLNFTIDDSYTIDPLLEDTGSNAILVVGINQQTLKRYVEPFHSGSIYGTDWEEGYYKVHVRQFKKPYNNIVSSLNGGIESYDFFEMTKKELYWNKSILSFMVYLQPGTYTMGSPLSEIGRSPDEVQHKVTLTDGFYVSRTVLTNGMFDAVMKNIKPNSDLTSISVGGQTKSTCFSLSNTYWDWYRETDKTDRFGRTYISYNKYQSDKSSRDGDYSGFGLCTNNGQTTYYPYPYLFNNNLPVGETDNSFITVINSVLPIDSYSWDVPTEAQWEYFCRAGIKKAFNNGETIKNKTPETETSYNQEPQINEICWYKMHDGQRHECAMLKCNQWGLYDTQGNNWEWTKDYDNGQVFTDDPVIDPYESEYIPSSGGIYGDYSDAKIIRGGWAGWSSRACRAAYRYEDYVSAVAPSFGVRLILRKSSIPITISPEDITVCGDKTVTTADCTYSLSRPLINSTDTVTVTYSVNNTNNTISITNATITYNGSENYQYDVTIGPNATIHRTTPEEYTPILQVVYNGPSLCKQPGSYVPTLSDFDCNMVGGIVSGDTVYNITYTTQSTKNDFTASISSYEISTPSGCYVYNPADIRNVYIVKKDCQEVIEITLTPQDVVACMANTSSAVPTSLFNYIIEEDRRRNPETDIITVSYSIDGNQYSISEASITSGSEDYRYELILNNPANITKNEKTKIGITISPSIELKDYNRPITSADTPSDILDKLIITPVADNLQENDTISDLTCTCTINGGVATIQTNNYTINYNHIGCYRYTPIGLGSVTYDIPPETETGSITYPVSFTPIVKNTVCSGYTVTNADINYIYNGIIVNNDTVNLTYSIDNVNNTVTITNASITKSNPYADYDYNITTNQGTITRNEKEQLYITLTPKAWGIIKNNSSDSEIISHIEYEISGDTLYFDDLQDTISNLTYSVSRDSNDIATVSIDSYDIIYASDSCRTYNVTLNTVTLYPINISGNTSVCEGVVASTSNTSISENITGYLQQGDNINDIRYYDAGTEIIVPNLNFVQIEKTQTGNYWYYFSSSSVDITHTSKTQVPVCVTPNCNVTSTIYSSDLINTIKGKLSYNCIVTVVKQNPSDTVDVTNKTSSNTYNVELSQDNKSIIISMVNNFTLTTTTNGCYEYYSDQTNCSNTIQMIEITEVIPLTVNAVELLNIDCSIKESLYGYTLTGNVNPNDTIGTPTYSYDSTNNTYVVTNLPITIQAGAKRSYSITYNPANITCQSIQNKTLIISGTINDICDYGSSMDPSYLQDVMQESVNNRVMSYKVDNVEQDQSLFTITYNTPVKNS